MFCIFTYNVLVVLVEFLKYYLFFSGQDVSLIYVSMNQTSIVKLEGGIKNAIIYENSLLFAKNIEFWYLGCALYF